MICRSKMSDFTRNMLEVTVEIHRGDLKMYDDLPLDEVLEELEDAEEAVASAEEWHEALSAYVALRRERENVQE